MASTNPPEATTDEHARHPATEQDKVKARKWFERALEFGNQRKYDSAIEYYVQGLGFWPDAVDEGLRPLHGCAVAFKQTGGKKPGLKDTMKRSMTGKDVPAALLNSLWLFGHDPDNSAYMEGVLKNAGKLHCDDLILWAAPVFRKQLEAEKKPNVKRTMLLKEIVEETAERAAARGEAQLAIQVLETGVEAVSGLARRMSGNREVETTVRDLSTRLTIVRGRYQEGDSFKASLQNEEAQMDIQDRERLIQTDERQEELIAKTKAAYEANPNDMGVLNRYVDMLCKRDHENEEVQAIGVLVDYFKRTNKYSAKQRADDIRIKQLRRRVRELSKSGDREGSADAGAELLRFEMKVYKDRLDHYPTDLRIRFEYGVRLFKAGQYDEAIPFLQRARTDPKNHDACGLYLGRCFFKKGFFDQAAQTLRATVEEREIHDDAIGRELMYWLGRSLESASAIDDARKVYGQLLQIDYNYRDVRDRLEGLPGGGQAG